MNEHPHSFAPHPWQGAYDDFNARTLPLLLEHGRAIGAEQSDESREIIRLYGMLHRSFDPMTASMLRDLVGAWVALNERLPRLVFARLAAINAVVDLGQGEPPR